MRAFRIVRRLAIAGIIATSAPGCGGSGDAGDARSAGLTPVGQVGKMLQVYQKGLKPPAQGAKDLPVYRKPPIPPPRGLSDLTPMARGFPLAVQAIRDGDVLLYWKTSLSDEVDASTTVLAYDRKAPEQGGEVLLRDGSIRTMSAGEFQAAKKPAGAKTADEMPAPDLKAKRPRG